MLKNKTTAGGMSSIPAILSVSEMKLTPMSRTKCYERILAQMSNNTVTLGQLTQFWFPSSWIRVGMISLSREWVKCFKKESNITPHLNLNPPLPLFSDPTWKLKSKKQEAMKRKVALPQWIRCWRRCIKVRKDPSMWWPRYYLRFPRPAVMSVNSDLWFHAV